MRMRTTALTLAIALITPLAPAAEDNLKVTTAAEDIAKKAAPPALISTTAASDGDSPLVRAAKETVAKRKRARTVTVIDNERVKRATGANVSEPTQPLPPLPLPPPPEPHGGTPVVPPPPFDRENAEKTLKQLEREQARLSEEAEQHAGELDEDAVVKRLTEIESEKASLRKALDAHPPGMQKP